MADERKYYVFCGDNCKFESMTKQQIYDAIAQATGNTPTPVDEAFITKIKEQNANKDTKVWTGTEAQYNALTTKDANTLYFLDTNKIAPNEKQDKLTAGEGIVITDTNVIRATITSYVGMVIHSTTLATEAQVKAYYGGNSWQPIITNGLDTTNVVKDVLSSSSATYTPTTSGRFFIRYWVPSSLVGIYDYQINNLTLGTDNYGIVLKSGGHYEGGSQHAITLEIDAIQGHTYKVTTYRNLEGTNNSFIPYKKEVLSAPTMTGGEYIWERIS